jgi:hypothetical protein
MVRTVTDFQWKYKQEFFNHYGKHRSRTDHHIDHQLSIYDGFAENIPPYILGHWTNLHMLSAKDNISKNKKSVINSSTLFKNYFWAIKQFNEIK